jgi:GT2 family glycosyltransferase
VRSLVEVTTAGDDLEVIVVADPATPPAVRDELARWPVRIVGGDGPFNFSARCNLGVAESSGELVALLNDDVLVEQADWLDAMIGFFAEPDVGVVGAKLRYPDGTLQHAGILLNEQPLHIFRGFPDDDPGPFGLLEIDREVSAVTGACLLTRRKVWDELGGLPEDFAVAFNDLDFCLRARAAGYRIIWTPHAALSHFESQTRRSGVDPEEIALLYRRWGPELSADPFGHPRFAPRQAEWVDADRATTWNVLVARARAWRHRRLLARWSRPDP